MNAQRATERGRSPRFEFPVERGKILEFARAIRSDHPAFRGVGALAPPTFLIVAGEIWGYSWERPGDSPLADAAVDASHALHLEETYEFFGAPLHAGEVLEGELVYFEPVEKIGRRSGRMSLHTTETTFWRPSGERAALARQVIAQLHDSDRAADPPADTAGAAGPAAGGGGERAGADAATDADASCRSYGPLRLEDFVAYQAASGDLNPHHYDPAVLAASGFSRFFSPGMLQAGFLGGQLVDLYGAGSVRRISVLFRELVYLGDVVTCRVSRLASQERQGEVELECVTADGRVAIAGRATIDAHAG